MKLLRLFALIRFMLPDSIIKISGGRETKLTDEGEALLQSGANGIITSGYLTMGGNDASKRYQNDKKYGLKHNLRFVDSQLNEIKRKSLQKITFWRH